MSTRNNLPNQSGEFTDYLQDPTTVQQSSGKSVTIAPVEQRRVLFVNGTHTHAARAANAALRLSLVVEGIVLHDYNQIGEIYGVTIGDWADLVQTDTTLGFLDVMIPGSGGAQQFSNDAAAVVNWGLGQAGSDQTVDAPQVAQTYRELLVSTLRGMQANDENERRPVGPLECLRMAKEWADLLTGPMSPLSNPILALFFQNNPSCYRALVRTYFAENPAIQTLYDFLLDNSWPLSPLLITCHSEGNLVVALALYGVAVVNSSTMPRPTKVFALASPSPTWPVAGNLNVRFFTNPLDWAPVFSGPTSYAGAFFGDVVRGKLKPSVWAGRKGTWGPDVHLYGNYLTRTGFTNEIRADLGLGPMPEGFTPTLVGALPE